MNNLELTDVNKYRLDEINKIKEYFFDNEIKERKDIIKKLNKYIVSFDYLDKIFITLSASFGTFKYSFIRCSGMYTSCYCRFFFNFNIYNRYEFKYIVLQLTKKRKKKHNKITLATSKLNTIETLFSALNDSKISHEKFTNIITEKNIYEKIKENIEDIKEEEKSTAEPSSLERTTL